MGRHRSIKNQICHLVKTLLHSLLHIAAIFCQQSPTGKKGKNGTGTYPSYLSSFLHCNLTQKCLSCSSSCNSLLAVTSKAKWKVILPHRDGVWVPLTPSSLIPSRVILLPSLSFYLSLPFSPLSRSSFPPPSPPPSSSPLLCPSCRPLLSPNPRCYPVSASDLHSRVQSHPSLDHPHGDTSYRYPQLH